MVSRKIKNKIVGMSAKMPIISITGPRQSGKTTFCRMCFSDHDYVNLENPDTLDRAKSDPRLFLSQHKTGMIIDEAQRMPELFSYIQTISDDSGKAGEFILTGSQNFLLSEKVSQSLSGRVFITYLLPFSMEELKETNFGKISLTDYLFKGSYPRIYDKDIPPDMFYPSYIQTYAERDVRQIVNVSNLFLFQQFMKLTAGRVGQLLNYNSLSMELGVDLKTIKSWFSILEASFIVFLLHPHHKNFKKRIVKTPKLYFYDTGLACSLLGIKNASELEAHWAKGALFENMVLSELKKNYFNRTQLPPLYFWRDQTGNELDVLIDAGKALHPGEIKAGTTITPGFFKGIHYYSRIGKSFSGNPFLFYGGEKSYKRKEAAVFSWRDTNALFSDVGL